MGLFGSKKNSESLHTLNEKDIRKKLYGSLLPDTAEPLKAPEPARETRRAAKPSAPTNPVPAATKMEEPDLFQPQNPVRTAATDGSPALSESPARKEHKPPKESKRIHDYVRQENEAFSEKKHSSAAASTHTVQKAEAKPPFLRVVVYPMLARASRIVMETLVGFVKVLAGAVIGLILSIDFRKPWVRFTAYVLAAVLLVGGLLWGIHTLNARREIAMKNPVVKSKAAALSESSSVASPQAAQPSNQDTANGTESQNTVNPEAAVPAVNPASSADAGADQAHPYVIQVATYASETDAGRVISRFSDYGIKGFVKALSRPSGKQYYCVFIGRFETYEMAEQALAQFKNSDASKPYQDSFIRRL